jgi:signal transduction histidine kinase
VVATALASVIKRERLTALRIEAERAQAAQLAVAAEELASAGARAVHDEETAIFQERVRFSGQIHDTLAQSFTGTLLHLEALRIRASRGETVPEEALQAVRKIAALGLAEARRSALAIRPMALDKRDLATALKELTERSIVPELLNCRWTLRGTPRPLRHHRRGLSQYRPRSRGQRDPPC